MLFSFNSIDINIETKIVNIGMKSCQILYVIFKMNKKEGLKKKRKKKKANSRIEHAMS